MKLLATNDVHQMNSKWKSLVEACQEEKFDVVVVAGDLCPKDRGILAQMSFLPHMQKYANKIKDTGATLVLTLGNDDNQLLIPDMIQGDEDGLWIYAVDKVVEIDGYEFTGMPFVPDYPFGYKFWCRPEFADKPRVCDERSQSTFGLADPVLVNGDNEYEDILDFDGWFKSRKSIDEELNSLVPKVKDMSKSIWLIHAPPSHMDLDVCGHGLRAGSDAVLKFVMDHQPMLCIHGHIHESPECNGKDKWCHTEGDTLCVQCGQLGRDLYYSVLEIEDGEVKSKKHSIYG